MSQYYLGFDAGTQSVKVAVYDENGSMSISLKKKSVSF